jgi:hypothetical protein
LIPEKACPPSLADVPLMCCWWGSESLDICLEVRAPLNRHIMAFERQVYLSLSVLRFWLLSA